MKPLLIVFLLIHSQAYAFNKFTYNETNTNENPLQELNKQSEKTSVCQETVQDSQKYITWTLSFGTHVPRTW